MYLHNNYINVSTNIQKLFPSLSVRLHSLLVILGFWMSEIGLFCYWLPLFSGYNFMHCCNLIFLACTLKKYFI